MGPILEEAKRAFGQESEARDLGALVDRHLAAGDICWLEVGAGDGKNLDRLVNGLSTSRRIKAVAVEPVSDTMLQIPGVTWVKSRVEDFKPAKEFDWINVRQSAYYFADIFGEVHRLVGWLSRSGGISITHWTGQCALYQLHRHICERTGNPPCPTFEDIRKGIEQGAIQVLEAQSFHCPLDLAVLAAHDTVALAVYYLALRGRPDPHLTDRDRISHTLSVFERIPQATRANGILIGRR